MPGPEAGACSLPPHALTLPLWLHDMTLFLRNAIQYIHPEWLLQVRTVSGACLVSCSSGVLG
jgi:hypothetical protein